MARPSETETPYSGLSNSNSNSDVNDNSTNENAMAIIAPHSSHSSHSSSHSSSPHRPSLSPLDIKQEHSSTSPPPPASSSSPLNARSSSTPSFCGSSSSSLYSPTLSSPYPVVHSSPSPIDLARSSPATIPPEQPQLYSSPFSYNQYTVEDPTVVDPLSSTLTPMASYPPLPQSIAHSPPPPATLYVDTSSSLPPPQQLHQPYSQSPPPPVSEDTTEEPGRPRSVIDFALDGAGPANPAGRRVRRNILARLGALPRNSRIVIFFSVLMMLIKVASTVVVLILDGQAADVLLKSLVILYALKAVISLPFTIFAHMNPRRQGEPLTARDILLERYRTLMEIAGTCLFFLSNYFLFSKPGWRNEAPATFFLCVANVAIGYIVILIPVLLCLAVILCLPLVVRIMRYLDIGPVVGIKGATEEMIAAIPVVIYKKPVEPEASPATVVDMGNPTPSGSQGERTEPVTLSSSSIPGDSPSPSTSSPPQPTSSSVAPSPGRRSKGGFLGFFMKGKKQSKGKKPSEGSSPTPAVEYLTLSDAQDAVCAICLCDYEDDEELRKMACTHYFHKECVDEWLRLHKNCPLCKRDIEDLAGTASGASSRSPTTST